MNIRSFAVTLFLLLSFSVSAFSATREIAAVSKISGVTIYNDRAQITRSAQVFLEQGTNVVTFDGLPLIMAEESLRAEGKGGAGARISGLTVRTVYLEKTRDKRVKEMEDEIFSLERTLQKIEARRIALTAQRSFIESIKVGWGERLSKDLTRGKPSNNELAEAHKFIGDGIFRIEEQLSDAEAEKKPTMDRIAALRNQLDQSRAEGKKEVRVVEVTVEAPRPMELAMELSYLVSQASWEPAYDIRLAPDGKSAELVYRAVIQQKTGEDWQGVTLSLSTSNPSTGSSPPELNPWRIAFYEPFRPMDPGTRKAKKAAPTPHLPLGVRMEMDSLEAVQTAVSQAQFVETTPLTAQITEGQTSVLFVVPRPVDLPSDGTRHSSVIALERVPVIAEYVTVPKLSPKVFLKSEVTNMTAFPLLAGLVNVFNDTAYAGKVRLKTVAAGEKFDLFFGADDQVKVKRKVSKIRKDAGLLAGNLVSWRCTVELENYKADSINLTLLDQMPVPGNEEIRVTLAEAQPKTDEIRPEGILVWKNILKPGEKRKISYEIDVEYPKGREITGAE